MPLTLPAHAAAALPFLRVRWLHAHALVIGCCAPDLAYLFDIDREISHGFVWGVPCGVLVGMLAFVWAELLVLPAIAAVAPSAFYVDVRRLFTPQWPPTSWLSVIVALAVGAFTHIAWDGLTHPFWWPAYLIYPEHLQVFGPKLVWKVSTIIGSAAVFLYVYHRYRARRFLDVRVIAYVAAATTFTAFIAFFVVGWRVLPRDPEVPHWAAQVLAMRILFSVGTLWCWYFKHHADNYEPR